MKSAPPTRPGGTWLAIGELCAAMPFGVAARAMRWEAVDPAWLAITAPSVEKDADAEVLEWRVEIDENADRSGATAIDNFLRIKIFDEKAIESQGKIDLIYSQGRSIENIAGRTIQPDGTVVLLAESAIFERTIATTKRVRVNSRSFALPAVKAGSIVEYQWREVSHANPRYRRLELARDIPVRRVIYRVIAANYQGLSAKARTFNSTAVVVSADPGGYRRFEATNIPAVRVEPFMPPRAMVEPWVLLFYIPARLDDAETFWKKEGRGAHGEYTTLLNLAVDTRKAAAGIVGDAATLDEKLERIMTWARAHVRRVEDPELTGTAEKRAWRDRKRSAQKTFDEGIGDAVDVSMLVAAMARAVGLDARVASAASGGFCYFDPQIPDPYFLTLSLVAAKAGDGWRVVDPATRGLPFGMIRWEAEGQQALVPDPDAGFFITTAIAPPEKSRIETRATLVLSADGTLEGEIREERTGHEAVDEVTRARGLSESERKEDITERIEALLPGAEVSGVVLDASSPAKDTVTTSYRVRVPGYATRTGRRMLVQPSVLNRGRRSVFPSSVRRYPVYFPHGLIHDTEISIALPEGFTIENADSLKATRVEREGVVVCTFEPRIRDDGRRLELHRIFRLEGRSARAPWIDVSAHAPLKDAFDAIDAQDEHAIALLAPATAGGDAAAGS